MSVDAGKSFFFDIIFFLAGLSRMPAVLFFCLVLEGLVSSRVSLAGLSKVLGWIDLVGSDMRWAS